MNGGARGELKKFYYFPIVQKFSRLRYIKIKQGEMRILEIAG